MWLAPSILAADLCELGQALTACGEGGAELIHVDVMDGHFVPNLSFGLPVVAALRQRTAIPLDVHLMVSNPERLLGAYLAAGAARVTVHWEAATHLHRLLVEIRAAGALAGVALNPGTPVEVLVDVLPDLDQVLVMSVDPGFSGQQFLPLALGKARRLRRLLAERGLPVAIEMDGGLNRANIRAAADAGVDIGVVGSALFGSVTVAAELRALRREANLESA